MGLLQELFGKSDKVVRREELLETQRYLDGRGKQEHDQQFGAFVESDIIGI